MGFFPQFQTTLDSEIHVLQPTQALALQDTPTPREGHATSAKPAKGSGRALRVEAAKPGTLLLLLTAQSSSSSRESLVNTHV